MNAPHIASGKQDTYNTAEARPEAGVKSVHIAFDVLEAVANSPRDVGVTELTELLGSTKATIFRHLQTLVARGYISQNLHSARYRLGVKAQLLGRLYEERFDLLTGAEPIIRSLRDTLKQTIALGVVSPRGVTIMETMLSQNTLEIGVRRGSEMAFHSTAQGKVALAFSRQPLMDTVKQQYQTRYTEHTICDLREIELQTRLARERGWATASQEMVLGINAIAVPILNDTGDCIATLAVVGSMQFVRPVPSAEQVKALQQAANLISANLGYRGEPILDAQA
ncbi:IclR family transcriptional regulator [Pollutimonas thiosulfatoxidans]|uniref:IclR family transcriptional regulator n=1 Tax=Pollutimonas thiosulfatoxidans TaxID=2028345 RepID=A0A410GD41_9BURK|nr:IclR family transcriptional regulator [Pollutimonas thiosulfatoxidans]QAA94218.1 hypothetical protein CKA81_10520 [Pollutimonas thiosulfatoxidans]